MDPQVRYVRSADSASIAYWSLGDGETIVSLPYTPFSHIQLEWQIVGCRTWYERLRAGRRLVRYDSRGTGLSDRECADYSLEANLADLRAVVDRLELDRFALMGSGDQGMVAIAYAAQHPERASHLVLWESWACREDVSSTPQTRTLRALLEQDWEIYTETVARVLLGWREEAQARQFAAFYRECSSPEVLRQLAPAAYEWDARGYLADVRCPALVMHRREFTNVNPRLSQELAARMPNAQLAVIEGRSPLPFFGDVEAPLQAIHEFLGYEDSAASGGMHHTRTPVTILFTDMEGSTPLTQRLGDKEAQSAVNAHNRITRSSLRTYGGTEVKQTGDGIMAWFPSASAALECAIQIQRRIAAHADAEGAVAFRVRIGLNAGEPVEEDNDLFGTSVQLAARVCEHAEPGQVLVTSVVRDLAAGKRFLFSQHEEVVLRGFEDPVRLWEVLWTE